MSPDESVSDAAVVDLFARNRDAVGIVSPGDLQKYDVYALTDDTDLHGAGLVEELNAEYALLHALAIDDAMRRQGLGIQLVEKIATNVDASTLEAKCKASGSANSFYEQAGWTLERETNDGKMNVWHYR